MSNKIEKSRLKELLIQRDFDKIRDWAENIRNPQRALLSLAFDSDELIRWRAIETIGKVTALWAKNDLKKIRNLIRQQLWQMNDESGGLVWHAPEIIGEILVNVPELVDEFAPLFFAYLDEEPFERGSHLAVYRVASIDPRPFVDWVKKLTASLDRPDKYIRAYALLALGEIDPSQVKKVKTKYDTETEEIRIFNFTTGEPDIINLQQIVRQVLERNKTSIDAA